MSSAGFSVPPLSQQGHTVRKWRNCERRVCVGVCVSVCEPFYLCLFLCVTPGVRSQHAFTRMQSDIAMVFNVSRRVDVKGQRADLLEPLTLITQPPPYMHELSEAAHTGTKWWPNLTDKDCYLRNLPMMQLEWDKQSDASSFRFCSRSNTSVGERSFLEDSEGDTEDVQTANRRLPPLLMLHISL